MSLSHRRFDGRRPFLFGLDRALFQLLDDGHKSLLELLGGRCLRRTDGLDCLL